MKKIYTDVKIKKTTQVSNVDGKNCSIMKILRLTKFMKFKNFKIEYLNEEISYLSILNDN